MECALPSDTIERKISAMNFKDSLKSNLPLFGLIVFSLLFACIGEWRPFFFDIDEPKYVTAAMEMARSGDWLHPMLGGLPRVEKPPLPYWLAAPLLHYLGTDFSNGTLLFIARIPAILCSVLSVIGTYFIGKRLHNHKTGLFAALLLAVTPTFKIEGMMLKADIIYTAAVTWATYFYISIFQGKRKPGNIIGASTFTALGVLTKGPFALPPLVGYLLATFFRNRCSETKTIRAALSTFKNEWLPILSGILACVPFLIWILAASMDNMPYLDGMLGDFSHNTSDRGNLFIFYSKSVGFYLLEGIVLFFPLGPFAAFGIYHLFKEKNWRNKDTSILIWTAFLYLLINFFLFRLRAHRYFMPMMPFFAVIATNWLLSANRNKVFKRMFRSGGILIALAVAAIGALVLYTNQISVNLWRNVPVNDFTTQTIPFAASAFVLALIVISAIFKFNDEPRKFLAAAFAGTLLIYPFYFNAAPGPDTSGKMSPAPVLGANISKAMSDNVPENSMIAASDRTLRLNPDLHFFLRNFSANPSQGYLASLPFNAQIFSAMIVNPAQALHLLNSSTDKDLIHPLSRYLKDTHFRKTVLILSGYEVTMLYRNSIYLNRMFGSAALSIPVQGMNVNWDKDVLYFVTLKGM